jgi:hypothetical protein
MMKLMQTHNANWVDVTLWMWFAVTAISVLYVGWDLILRTPEMKVMKWGWVLVTLYTGPVAFAVYWLSCREAAPGTHEKSIAPLWKQSVGSTIHCMAGDATGVFIAAAVTNLLGLPMGVDAAVEYVAGFAIGLLVFQALFMMDMTHGSYWQAIKSACFAEWISMNAMMAGMIPVMIILMTKDMQSMAPNSLRFWGVMSLGSLVGGTLAYPVNWWLVRSQLKHGMGTERALGKGGTKVAEPPTATGARGRAKAARPSARESPTVNMGEMKEGSVSAASKFLVAFVTIAMLAVGVTLAAVHGDLLMRSGTTLKAPMSMPQ